LSEAKEETVVKNKDWDVRNLHKDWDIRTLTDLKAMLGHTDVNKGLAYIMLCQKPIKDVCNRLLVVSFNFHVPSSYLQAAWATHTYLWVPLHVSPSP
jgi:hypothetical protein